MANQLFSSTAQPPPDLPAIKDLDSQLAQYLRTFALWCRNGFADKLSAHTALPGILLQAYDPATGHLTNVSYMMTLKDGTPPTLVFTKIQTGAGAP